MKSPHKSIKDVPAAFLDRIAGLLGEDYQAFLASLQLPAVTGLRVNTLKIPVSDFLNRIPWKRSPVMWCPSGFTIEVFPGVATQIQPGKHPYHAAGLFYLQEPSAMAASEALAPRPGEIVLDLAAAPGGKATHLASLMNNTGTLVANEIHPKRVWDLVENLERCGITNAVVTNETPQRLADHFGELFDRVMLDAPCSGEGMFRRAETARREWKPELVRSCALRQAAILEQAARMVKPGGQLAYTTCTFSPDEDEGVIANFLAKHTEFDLKAFQPAVGLHHARPDWVGLPPGHKLNRAIRIWPHLAEGEGHFIAVLVKQGSTSESHQPVGGKKGLHLSGNIKSGAGRYALSLMDEFQRANLATTFDPSRLANIGSYVYQLQDIALDLTGLSVIHPGWWLGSIQKKRFTPSHSLAMGITCDQSHHSLHLAHDDPRLLAYFTGESISNEGDNAWVLVCVDDFPVGWAKRVQNVLKNFYPHGLRRSS